MYDKRFTGVIPPAITPFDEEGRVDEGALRRLSEFWAGNVNALFVCGTYGSGPLMAADERKRVADVVLEGVAGRIPVIVHAGAITTEQAVDLARHAERAGAKAVAAVPPFYYEHPDEAIRAHYKALVDAVSIPVYAYNNPKTARNAISPQILAELAEAGVSGIKDSSFDILYFYGIMRKVRKQGFEFIMGTEALALPAWLCGSRACVSGLANALPEPVSKLMSLCGKGAFEEAGRQQQLVLALRDVMHLGPTISVIHAVLELRGIPSGRTRPPFQPVSDTIKARLKSEFISLGVDLAGM